MQPLRSRPSIPSRAVYTAACVMAGSAGLSRPCDTAMRRRVGYNRFRPHSALGDRTPEEFKEALQEAG